MNLYDTCVIVNVAIALHGKQINYKNAIFKMSSPNILLPTERMIHCCMRKRKKEDKYIYAHIFIQFKNVLFKRLNINMLMLHSFCFLLLRNRTTIHAHFVSIGKLAHNVNRTQSMNFYDFYLTCIFLSLSFYLSFSTLLLTHTYIIAYFKIFPLLVLTNNGYNLGKDISQS